MKKAGLFLSIVFLLSFVSAGPFQDQLSAKISNYSYPVPDSLCHAFYYPLLKMLYNNFKVEIKTTDTNEDFFLVIQENNCQLTSSIIDAAAPDVVISIDSVNGTYSATPMTMRAILAHTRFQPFLPNSA